MLKRLLLCCLLLVPAAPVLAALVGAPLMRLEGGLQQPSAVAVAEDGRAFVLDGLQRRIQVFDPRGALRDSLPLPPGTMPATDIAIQGERLYVADPTAHRILILDGQGRLLDELLPRPDERTVEPSALLVSQKQLWWSDRRGHRLCRSQLDDGRSTRCQGGQGEMPGRFRYPYMLAADARGYVLAVDVLNARVQLFAPDGKFSGSMGRFGLLPGQLFRPNGIAVLEDGGVLVSDAWTGSLTLFRQRKARGLLRHRDGRPWRFAMPVGMTRWKDRLYVVDLQSNRVEVLRLTDDGRPAPPLPQGGPSRDSRRNCLQCHVSWSPDHVPEADAPVLPVAEPRMCLSCHHGAVVDSRPRLGQGHQHPTLHEARDGKPAGDAQRFEEDEVPQDYPLAGERRLYCASCHTPHDRPEGGEPLGAERSNPWLRKANRDSALCLDCHASRRTAAEDRQRKDIERLNHPLGVIMKRPPKKAAAGYAAWEELQQGLPDALKQAGARLGTQGRLICQSCHQVHGAEGEPLLAAKQEGSRLCVTCHQAQHSRDEKDARRKGVHPVGLKLDEEVELGGKTIRRVDCLACHSVHDAQPGTALLPRGKNARSLCPACHGRQNARDKEDALKKGVHPVNTRLDDPVKLAGREIRELDCRSCHSVHEGVQGTPALVADHADGTLCKSCHEEQEKLRHTDHDLGKHPAAHRNRLKAPWKDAGLCGACHSLHRGKGEQPFLFVGAAWQVDDKRDLSLRDVLCLSCHHEGNQVDAKPVEDFSHPWKDLILRSDVEKMPLLDEQGKISEFGRIGCITCHEPHHWRPGNNPPQGVRKDDRGNEEGTVQSSFLRREDLAGSFCVNCHGREAKLKYKYYHDAAGRGKKPDYLH
ncbi:cytochrome c3 family protein [Thiolapillus brandeum]|uniref:Doubled CXXCH motif domain-containing protein n=1 Tax=Thiolapillus brandeum TaxID=1076588 RepID=A0A7U6GL76_9GAMM|nr:cytochrome c3 family protein [Thiolapillus brandeum]BAO45679.1 conserved hypothetical protein [Thiolapillus brandeum]